MTMILKKIQLPIRFRDGKWDRINNMPSNANIFLFCDDLYDNIYKIGFRNSQKSVDTDNGMTLYDRQQGSVQIRDKRYS